MSSLAHQFQLSNQTRLDRFPKIFRLAQKCHPEAKRVLSFGCSTGEECFSLARYFSEATITGTDIDRNCIKAGIQSRNQNGIKNVVFSSEPKGQYDVIFALMVFFSIDNPIKKPDFYAGVNELAERVKPGGVILFHGLEFPFDNDRFLPIRTWQHENDRKRVKGYKYYGGAFRRKNYVN